MAKINIAWIPDETADSVVATDDMSKYVSETEKEIDTICLTQGMTAGGDIPLDDDGFYLSPALQVAAKYKLLLAILKGYSYSSDGDVDAYALKLDTARLDDEKWEKKITYNSIRLRSDSASETTALVRSIPVGG